MQQSSDPRDIALRAHRKTGIEWTTMTWNFAVGCSIVSPGCTNCYAMKMAARIIEMKTTDSYDGTIKMANGKPIWTGRLNLSSKSQREKPLKVRDPSMIFVNSMSDFFHPSMLDEWRQEAIGIMQKTPQHHYQVLTKRPEEIQPFLDRTGIKLPRNFWCGATVERGDFAHRIDTLRAIDAYIRFLSVEPIIGRIGPLDLTGIHWVIGGGESGPGARGMEPEWARELRDQCIAQNVPFFWKQWGKPQNNPLWREAIAGGATSAQASDYLNSIDPVGKGGSQIDGKEWKEYPRYELQSPLL